VVFWACGHGCQLWGCCSGVAAVDACMNCMGVHCCLGALVRLLELCCCCIRACARGSTRIAVQAQSHCEHTLLMQCLHADTLRFCLRFCVLCHRCRQHAMQLVMLISSWWPAQMLEVPTQNMAWR
jgi:hypothetical protein